MRILIAAVGVAVFIGGYFAFTWHTSTIFQAGMDRGASIMYERMNTDLIHKLKIHYDPQERVFRRYND